MWTLHAQPRHINRWSQVLALSAFCLYIVGYLTRNDERRLHERVRFHDATENRLENLTGQWNSVNSVVLSSEHDTSSSSIVVPTKKTKQKDKVIVLGRRADENASWVEELQDWDHAVYVVNDRKAPLHTPKNKGKDAMIYLSYIIDHYDNLPATMAFVRNHRSGYPAGWHIDNPSYSNVVSLTDLQIDFVQRSGFANLRCNWNPGCPDEIHLFRDPEAAAVAAATVSRRYNRHDDPHRSASAEILLRRAWKTFFPGRNAPQLPKIIAATCCSQFAVSREQVLQRRRADYVRFRKWLLKTDLDDESSGWVMEYLWHIIFGKPPRYCPNYLQCRCNVYGKCCDVLTSCDDMVE